MSNESTIYLLDEAGNEVEFEIVERFKVDDRDYVVLQPTGMEEEEGVLFRIDIEDGEEVLETVIDDEEFQEVSEAYALLMSEED